MTRIAPMLAVSDGRKAIDFYVEAFDAIERWRIDAGGTVVAGLEIDGAEFYLADENPPSTKSPDTAGSTSVRIELFVDDPQATLERAIAAGAPKHTPVTHHRHATTDGEAFEMLQGGVTDPFGHTWLIGKFL